MDKQRSAALLASLKESQFRLLLSAQTISVVGDAAYLAVLAWYTFDSFGSTAAVSIVLVGTSIATLVSLLVGGVLADRWDRKSLMVLSDLARLILVGALASSIYVGDVSLPLVVALTSAAGLVDGLFTPSANGILPALVRLDLLTSANGLLGFVRATGAILGAALGGVLYAAAGPATVMLLNALSFGVSALLIAFIKRAGKPEDTVPFGFLKELRDGFRFVFAVPVLISIPVAAVALLFADAPTSVLLPAVVQEHFGGGVLLIGWLSASYGVGAGLGSLLAGTASGGARPAVIIFGCWALAHLVTAIMVAQPLGHMAIVLSLVRGLLGGIGGVLWNSLLMRIVPAHRLSRVFSIDTFGATGLWPVGIALGGLAANNFAAVTLVVAGQVIGFILMVSLLLFRRVRNA